jgi:hypothetical protein
LVAGLKSRPPEKDFNTLSTMSRNTVTAFLFLLAVPALPSCRGRHAPPPGFVKPGVLEGSTSLVVRIDDGAWQQASSVEDVERFEAVAGFPWLLAAAQLSGGCPPEMKAMCGEGEELNPLVAGPCDEGRVLASFPLEAAREFLEKKGFVFPGAAAWPACKDGKEEPLLRIDAVRLSRILRDLFSKETSLEDETLDDRIVNFIVTSGRVRRSGDGGLCGMEFESEGSRTWTAGWIPCEEPRSVLAVFGEKSWEKAMAIVAALEL